MVTLHSGGALGRRLAAYRSRAGGQFSRGSPRGRGRRSQASLRLVAGGGRALAQRCPPGLPSLLVCYMPLATFYW